MSAYQPANFLTVDGTAEAWFELVVFHRLAGQFYLFWHANYNDFSFITSPKKLNDVVKLRNEASEPLGQMGKDEHKIGISDLGRFVTVRYLGFSNWGGLYRFEETFTKAFPHRRIHDEKTHLMKYDCGICY